MSMWHWSGSRNNMFMEFHRGTADGDRLLVSVSSLITVQERIGGGAELRISGADLPVAVVESYDAVLAVLEEVPGGAR